MMFAIKAEITDQEAETFAFNAQKTMYGGKNIAKGDAIFVFASENEGGSGLIAYEAQGNSEEIGVALVKSSATIPFGDSKH